MFFNNPQSTLNHHPPFIRECMQEREMRLFNTNLLFSATSRPKMPFQETLETYMILGEVPEYLLKASEYTDITNLVEKEFLVSYLTQFVFKTKVAAISIICFQSSNAQPGFMRTHYSSGTIYN